MTDQALDNLARRLLLDAARLEYGDLMEELPEQDFSPQFEKKMRKLVRRGNHPIRYRVAQIAACLLLAALLSGCTVLAISPEAREAFLGWVRTFNTPKEFPPYYSYTYSGDGEAQLPEGVAYRPTWVPEGCQLFDEHSYYVRPNYVEDKCSEIQEAVTCWNSRTATLPPTSGSPAQWRS